MTGHKINTQEEHPVYNYLFFTALFSVKYNNTHKSILKYET